MRAGAALEHGHRPPHLAAMLVVAQQNDRVRQVADVTGRGIDRTHEAMLDRYQQRGHALLAEVGQQIADLQHQAGFVAHRRHVAGQAVDDHRAHAVLDGRPHHVRELARRQLERIDVARDELPILQVWAQLHAQPQRAREQDRHPLVEQVHRGFLAAL